MQCYRPSIYTPECFVAKWQTFLWWNYFILHIATFFIRKCIMIKHITRTIHCGCHSKSHHRYYSLGTGLETEQLTPVSRVHSALRVRSEFNRICATLFKAHSLRYIYVRDRCKIRTVLKPSDGFEAGQTAAKRAGRLRSRPDGFTTFH